MISGSGISVAVAETSCVGSWIISGVGDKVTLGVLVLVGKPGGSNVGVRVGVKLAKVMISVGVTLAVEGVIAPEVGDFVGVGVCELTTICILSEKDDWLLTSIASSWYQ